MKGAPLEGTLLCRTQPDLHVGLQINSSSEMLKAKEHNSYSRETKRRELHVFPANPVEWEMGEQIQFYSMKMIT